MIYLEILARAVVAIVVIVGLTRWNGLRSLSQMSSYEFVMTLAIASVLASTIIGTTRSLLIGVASLSAVFLVQAIVERLRCRLGFIQRVLDNDPLLLVRDGHILEANLRKSNITLSDLYSKLRQANTASLDEVGAVVLESTGDISVVHERSDGMALDSRMLHGVRES